MKKLVLGSLNIDHTYHVTDFVQPKQTIQSISYKKNCGGKGFNQAVAFARAGAKLHFAGIIGSDGQMLRDAMEREGIDTSLLHESRTENGHALIQVNESGENCIIVVGGANAEVNEDYITAVLQNFSAGDLLVLQNEVPCSWLAVREAKRKGMIVSFNPSPIDDELYQVDFHGVDYLFINEVEGYAITKETEPKKILHALHEQYPLINVVLTLGENGAYFLQKDGNLYYCAAKKCNVVDTTAAGDTFTGYFLEEYLKSADAEKALMWAAAASAITVSRAGAVQSIPYSSEVIL